MNDRVMYGTVGTGCFNQAKRVSHRRSLLGPSCALLLVLILLRLALDLSALSSLSRLQWLDAAGLQLMNLHLPRILSALIAGGALGVSGAVLQALTRNVLAAPDLLGITGGAQLGLILLLLAPGIGALMSPPVLFLFSLAAALVVFILAGGLKASMLRLIVAGTACSMMFGAVVTLLLVIHSQSVVAVGVWSSGIMYQGSLQDLALVALWIVPAMALLVPLKKPLEAIQLGVERACTLGVDLTRTRIAALLVAVVFSSVAVSLAGPVGFIGLLAPNLVRLSGRGRLSALLPLSALWGAALLLLADTLVSVFDGRGQLFSGTLIALLGTPLLLWLVLRTADTGSGSDSRISLIGRPRRIASQVAGLMVVVIVLMISGWLAGSEMLSPAALWKGIQGVAPYDRLLELRVPRTALALLGGALLAVSGVLMQSVIRNPLAGPEIIGLTQGAALFALLVLLLFPAAAGSLRLPAALVGGCTTLFIALWLNRHNRFAAVPMAITGIALSALCAALTQWLVVANSVQAVQALTWLAGGTYGRSWQDLYWLLPWLLAVVPLLLLAGPLRMLDLGDDNALALGINVARIRALSLLLAALLAAAVVAVLGPIGFVGLIAPHIARLLGARSVVSRLMIAAPVGAILLLVADLLGRTLVAPNEIPAGVMTAFLGAPYFLFLLWRHGRQQQPRHLNRSVSS
ncbi:MAG: iron ABC transporter permease [Oceanospirillales bacterium]|nr:iron ABC transporter permease [Oceanospirillales bacterium]